MTAAEGKGSQDDSTAPAVRSPTIYDVARIAGVSHQTVSRLLKGYQGIRPHTRERVEEALRELDYRPNMTARSLATNRSHRVGAFTHAIAEVGPSRIVQGASAGAREAGYLLDIVALDMGDEDSVAEAIGLMATQDIAGVLAFASTDAMTDAIRHADIRVPLMLELDADDATTGYRTELQRAVFDLVEHLRSLGHRRFFHIAGPQGWVAARNREFAYHRAVTESGLESLGVAHGDWSAASGYAAAERIPLEAGVTAVVASNDQMALGAILALMRRGLRVPEDVSVTGFDDIPEAAFFVPPLTTVKLDFEGQGRAAFARLLRVIDQTKTPVPAQAGAQLRIRESSGPAPR
ncbi:LacI family transcriptional regulator [Diaminobutyricimonas aerilata]|uniref:LacI family transcriptional regulator n=1 Tax=Diaminobutyricimonas aerilata TaxID=1162967 RepID=A0A2M9CF48_9MICO|nr:LacI family DNA-binding transcriptional regulator [Diaminobutyricimonas aerilata]PJJ70561.1 LacI family transcriptional regulator [Diaminobutyricimonas aerilata]